MSPLVTAETFRPVPLLVPLTKATSSDSFVSLVVENLSQESHGTMDPMSFRVRVLFQEAKPKQNGFS